MGDSVSNEGKRLKQRGQEIIGRGHEITERQRLNEVK